MNSSYVEIPNLSVAHRILLVSPQYICILRIQTMLYQLIMT